MLDVQLTDAKIFYDQDGRAKEVLISDDLFCKIQALLERLCEGPDQGYLGSEEWQARIREGETGAGVAR